MPDFIFTLVPAVDHATATDGIGRQVWEGTLEAAKNAIDFANSGGFKVSVVTDDRKEG